MEEQGIQLEVKSIAEVRRNLWEGVQRGPPQQPFYYSPISHIHLYAHEGSSIRQDHDYTSEMKNVVPT